MLFTRCPHCDTTFRVTEEALAKAGGQVRCGRCANVFNAYTELRELPLPAEPAAAGAAQPKPVAAPARAPATTSELTAATPAPAATSQPVPPPATPPPATAVSAASPSLAAPPAAQSPPAAQPPPETKSPPETTSPPEAKSASEAKSPPATTAPAAVPEAQAPDSISPEQIHIVLQSDLAADSTTAIWALENPPRLPASRGWSVAALLALAALGLQGIHHFRVQLAGQALVGPWLQQAYGMLGESIEPRWDVAQYQILDWIATAEPNARGQGSLQITARILNRGPRMQPFPQIHLQLKDRWEDTVGSRVFGPEEYLGAVARTSALMAPGDTAHAQLTVVDPGPDAYGFELDVCVEAEADVLTCGNDEVFL